MLRFKWAAVALAVSGAAMPAMAQNPASMVLGAPRIGLTAGVNMAKVSSSDFTDAKNRTGFNAGVYLAIPVAHVLDIQPELLYTRKGAKVNLNPGSGDIALDYLEVPVLAHINMGATPGVTPQIFFGPAVAFKVGCKLNGSDSGVSVSMNCDDAGTDMNSVDMGVVGGVGLMFGVGGHRAGISARYDAGLKNVSPNGNGKNRAISILASIEMPFGF